MWHYLTHDLELRSPREPEALQSLTENTLTLIDTIQSDTAFATVIGPHCERCFYRSICPAWTIGEGQLSFDWRAGPGVALPRPR